MADGVVYKPLVASMDRRSQAFGGRWSHLQAYGGIRGSPFTSLWWQMDSFTSLWWLAWIAVCKPLVAYEDRRSQAFGGRWSHLQAFGGICGSSCTRLLVAYVDRHVEALGGIRGLPIASLWWLTWIAVHKPLVADGVIYKPLVAYVDRRVHAFGGIRGSSFGSPWWHMWIAVHKPLVAEGVVYKPLVAYVDRRSQAFGGRWSHLQAFGGICGSSCTRLLVAYVDRHVEAFCGIRGLPIANLLWLTWIAVHKPLVADGVIYKPLVAYVDRRVHAFGGIRGSSFGSPWWYMWIAVHKPLVADGVVYKPLVACVERRLQAVGGRSSH